MEVCTLPQFDLRDGVPGPEDLGAIRAAFREVGAVQLKSALSPETAARLLAHVNARLAEELRRKSDSEKSELQRALLGILGGVPTPAAVTHSVADVVNFMLATWDGATPTLDEGVEALMCLLSEPDLDARIRERAARVAAQGGEPKCVPHNPAFFGNVHENVCRWDFRLQLDEVVAPAAAEVLQAGLASVVRACTHAGEQAQLCELSSIVSDPGSPRQPLHSDTLIESEDDAAEDHIVTCFVALQPIDATMGPTVILPSSHNLCTHTWMKGQRAAGQDAHPGADTDVVVTSAVDAAAVTADSGERACGGGGSGGGGGGDDGGFAGPTPTARQPAVPEDGGNPTAASRAAVCVCEPGDVVMMDSRAAHFGGANQSERRRVLFYMSFHAGAENRRPAFGSTLSLLPEYEGRFGLGGARVALPPWRA